MESYTLNGLMIGMVMGALLMYLYWHYKTKALKKRFEWEPWNLARNVPYEVTAITEPSGTYDGLAKLMFGAAGKREHAILCLNGNELCEDIRKRLRSRHSVKVKRIANDGWPWIEIYE